MQYQVRCKHLGLVGRPGPAYASKGDVLEADQLPADEIPKLIEMGAIIELGSAPAEELESLSRRDLDLLAAEAGLDTSGLKKKSDVVAAIVEARQVNAPATDGVDGEDVIE